MQERGEIAMGSRIKSFIFLGRSFTNDVNLQSKPYDSVVASDPPVRGSYPMAGNGPDVLDDIQRTRARTQSPSERNLKISLAAEAPSVPRRREDANQRPRTAPHDGTPGGVHNRSDTIKRTKGRTLSGLSTRSSPRIVAGSTRRPDSERSSNDRPPLPTSPSSPPLRHLQAYVPTHGGGMNSNGLSPAQSPIRASSHASHESYVDILDAQSRLRRTRETTLQRAKASGLRNYGEDVADRNIAGFGERSLHKQDLSPLEPSYLKSVYIPRKMAVGTESLSRAGSALGHVLEAAGDGGDHSQLSHGQVPPRTASLRPAVSSPSGPRLASVYLPRIDPASTLSCENGQSPDDHHRLTASNGAIDRTGRAMSPLSSTVSPMHDELPFRYHQDRNSWNSTRALPTPPLPERGRRRPTATTPALQTNPSPASLLSDATSQTNSRTGSPAIEPFSFKTTERSMSTTSQGPVVPPESANSSVLSQAPDHGETSKRTQTFSADKRSGTTIAQAEQSPGLEGVVDLNDSVGADITTKTLPAVAHEHVIPTRHEIRQEVLTREIHNHDVFHRILPVIETEILPMKHYIHSKDGLTLVEIPESMVPNHIVTGRDDQNWHIFKGPAVGPSSSTCFETASRASTDSAPDGPIIGLVRGEPGSHPRDNSRSSSTKSPVNYRQPILSSKKDSITKDGIPKTEFVWRHPPVFETVQGDTQPAFISAGIGDLDGDNYYSDDDDEFGARFGAARSSAVGEEDLLFIDSGYGSHGMLPGLEQCSPVATTNGPNLPHVVDANPEPIGKINVASKTEGEATQDPRRLKERRRSSVTTAVSAAKGNGIDGIEKRIRHMSLK